MRPTQRLCAAIVLALLIPATASASERIASPNGSGASCTQSAPCGIVTAINNAANGDDVTIEPGTYGSPTPISSSLATNGKTLTIHGDTDQPMPVIYTDASAFGIGLTAGSSLSYVDIEDSSNDLRARGIEVASGTAAINHVISHVTGSELPVACAPIGTLIDSLCWSSGPGGTGASIGMTGPSTQTSTLINDTLIGSGSGSYGVLVLATGGFTTTLNMTNSIARGTGSDVYMDAGPTSASTAILNADHSNYGSLGNAMHGGTVTPTLPGTGSNELQAPAFVNAAAGNFHEITSSPTVDAGVVDSFAGMTDLDGNPRQVGPFTDIGAYQYIPPPTCSPVSATTAFQTATKIQLSCQDPVGAAVLYFSSQGPQHGTVTIDQTTGIATYTPAAGYSGPDSLTYIGQSTYGRSVDTTVSVTVGAPTPTPAPAPMMSAFKHNAKSFSFTLNEEANVTLTIKRKGHPARKVSDQGKAGANVIKLAKKLKPGTYTVTLSATNAGGAATTKPLKFTVMR
jgi:hypothetical protein